MKQYGKELLALLGTVALLVCVTPAGLAHSGRTDSYGGHNSASGYHYHHGYSAHQHVSGYCPYTDVFPTGVRLSAEKTVLGLKEQVTLTATVSPSNACSKSVSWSSSDTSVVRVSGGKVTAVGFGTATITASTFNDRTATIKITVQEVTASSVTLTGVEGPAQLVYIGDTLQLGAVLTPENVDRPQITWTSSDEAVATVADGLVTARDSGVTTITATTTNGLTARVELTVEEVIAQKIEIKAPDELVLGETVRLDSVITPANTTHQDVRWQSSNTSVAEITSEGFLTAKGVGEVTIQVIQKDVQAEMTFNIRHIPVTSLAIVAAGGFEGTLPEGETTQFTANIRPSNATYPAVTWTSSDPAVATVDESGVVTAVSEGEVTLTASTRDGATAEVSFRTGSTVNRSTAIAGGVGGGGIALLGGSYALLRRKKKSAVGEAKRSAEGEAKKGTDKVTLAFVALAVAVVGGAGSIGANGANADRYSRALFLAEAGRPSEAAALFNKLGSYQDSADRLTALTEAYPVVAFQFASKGDTVTFGAYEQDNDLSNGKEPIEWLVISKDQERMLVLSQKVLDVRPYIPDDWMDEEQTDMLDLYTWLYTTFADTAFEGCDMTPVRELRMMTREEAKELSVSILKAEYTPYARAQRPSRGYAAGYMWWLDGYFRFNRDDVGPVVWENGSAYNNSTDVDDRVGVRPVMVISLVSGEEYSFTFYSGKKDGPIMTVDRNGNVIGGTGSSGSQVPSQAAPAGSGTSAPAAAPAEGANAPSQAAPAGVGGSEAEDDVDWDAMDREAAEAKDRELWEAEHGNSEGSK